MSKIEVNYDDLQEVPGVDPVEIESLKTKEEAVRQAIAKIGRSCWVRWRFSSDERGDALR